MTLGCSCNAEAVSTSYWTGVKLCDLLKHVGAKVSGSGVIYVL